jgi:hypothetical protein
MQSPRGLHFERTCSESCFGMPWQNYINAGKRSEACMFLRWSEVRIRIRLGDCARFSATIVTFNHFYGIVPCRELSHKTFSPSPTQAVSHLEEICGYMDGHYLTGCILYNDNLEINYDNMRVMMTARSFYLHRCKHLRGRLTALHVKLADNYMVWHHSNRCATSRWRPNFSLTSAASQRNALPPNGMRPPPPILQMCSPFLNASS